MERRYDIDWLRVIAIGLLLIYHIGIAFQPWGIMIGFIQSEEPLEAIWPAMALLNVWRIPFLFFVSGMGVAFSIRKRSMGQLLVERGKRILIPFVFGVACIVPIHMVIFQTYYDMPKGYAPNPGHLWFLGNIIIYVLVLFPVFYLMKRDNWLSKTIRKVFSTPLGLLVILLCGIIEAMAINPGIFEMYALTWHGFALGFIAFFFGYCCVSASDHFWSILLYWKWVCLGIAIVLFVLRITTFHLRPPVALMSLESNLWIFAMLGFGYKYLNKGSSRLSYWSQGAYPIYIVHMVFLYLGSLLLFKTGIPTVLQLILLTVFTFLGCIVFYEIIRRIRILRPLFGLKLN